MNAAVKKSTVDLIELVYCRLKHYLYTNNTCVLDDTLIVFLNNLFSFYFLPPHCQWQS